MRSIHVDGFFTKCKGDFRSNQNERSCYDNSSLIHHINSVSLSLDTS